MAGKVRRDWVSLRIAPHAVALVRARASQREVPMSTVWREVIGAGLVSLGMVKPAAPSSPTPTAVPVRSGGSASPSPPRTPRT